MSDLSHDQSHALSHLLEWYGNERTAKRFVTLGGYAGTGKSTLIAVLRSRLKALYPDLSVAFASYTGKAARVLRGKLEEEGALYPKDSVSTIHALIYTPIVNDREEIVGWQQKDALDKGLVIIDEASMVDGGIWAHLSSYGVPIIAVGDHGQLPPINGSFNLMAKPDVYLDEIHRQAKGNPIIDVSVAARTAGYIQPGRYSSGVVKYASDDPDAAERMDELLKNYRTDMLILCGYNSTRKRINSIIRAHLGFESPDPASGDRVICLRNNHAKRLYNGMLGTIRTVTSGDGAWLEAEIDMDGDSTPYVGRISREQFKADSALNFTDKRSRTMAGDLFDFGYALTVHKAQGSQARHVVLFEERFPKMDDDQWKRWLYTAVTRAEAELTSFGR